LQLNQHRIFGHCLINAAQTGKVLVSDDAGLKAASLAHFVHLPLSSSATRRARIPRIAASGQRIKNAGGQG